MSTPLVLPDGVVRVCAWCWPDLEPMFQQYPHLRGHLITHGICDEHKTLVLERFKSGHIKTQKLVVLIAIEQALLKQLRELAEGKK